ncbi:MAG: hypothetical protein U1E76_23420 [Planctomycetota bacterium]
MRIGSVLLGLTVLWWSSATAADSIKAVNEDLQKAMSKRQLNDECVQELLDRCVALADAAIGTDAELEALTTCITLSRYSSSEKVKATLGTCLDRVVEGFIDSPKMAEIVATLSSMGDDEKIKGIIERIGKESTIKEVQAACLYADCSRRMQKETWGGGMNEVERKATIALLNRLIAEYGDLKDPFNRGYKETAQGNLIELQNFCIGAVAPNIEGKDLDGVAFKLSDYRGKVVMLDFWGDW